MYTHASNWPHGKADILFTTLLLSLLGYEPQENLSLVISNRSSFDLKFYYPASSPSCACFENQIFPLWARYATAEDFPKLHAMCVLCR